MHLSAKTGSHAKRRAKIVVGLELPRVKSENSSGRELPGAKSENSSGQESPGVKVMNLSCRVPIVTRKKLGNANLRSSYEN